jgi:NADPH-dependent ferric siderophore reductase
MGGLHVRGSFILPTDFDWHLLIGDETALPALARRRAVHDSFSE